MKRLEVSAAVRHLYMSLGFKSLIILIIHTNAFTLWLCYLLNYQNHKNFLGVTLPIHWCIVPLHVADGYVGRLKTLHANLPAELAF